MGKAEDTRAFKRFVGETVKEFILEVAKGRTDKGKWKNVFDAVRRKHYNNIAMAKYKEIMKDFPQPEEGEDIEEFIKNNFGDKKLNFYKRIKNINYTQPHGEYHEVKNPYDYYNKLANVIVEFVTNDKVPDLSINPNATNIKTLLTETYNAINGTVLQDFGDLSKQINDVIQQKQSTDQKNSEKRLKREVKRVKEAKDNERMEALAEKEREHEEDKRKLQQEHYADKEAATAYIRNKTMDEIKQQKQYKDEFIDDDREETNALIPYNEINEEVITEEDKAMKNAEDIHRRLQEDTLITRAATDNTFYNQLPDEIKQSLRPKIEEKKAIIERSKVIRYLLPKERPKWTNATMSKGVNPLLSRGAWGI